MRCSVVAWLFDRATGLSDVDELLELAAVEMIDGELTGVRFLSLECFLLLFMFV